MGRSLRRGFYWLVFKLTFGKLNLDPDAPPDFSKDKAKLNKDLGECRTALQEIQTETVKLQQTLDDHIAEVKKCGAEDKKTPNKVLCEIRLLRGQISINEARETVLTRKMEQITAHLGMIELHGDAKPVEVRDEVRKISDRIKVRVDTIRVDEDELRDSDGEVREAVAVSDLQAELRDIESEILGRDKEHTATKDLLEEAAAVAGHAEAKVSPAANTPEPGYDVVAEDEEPDQPEPPARQLDFG